MRRGFWTTIVLMALVGCASSGTDSQTKLQQVTTSNNPCQNSGGTGTQGPTGAPIVCIDFQNFDTSTYQPSPDPIQANSNVTVQFWFYNVGTATPQLDVQFTADTPVHNIQCQSEHCVVTVKPNSPKIQRKYSIIDRESGRHKDPDILIEPMQ